MLDSVSVRVPALAPTEAAAKVPVTEPGPETTAVVEVEPVTSTSFALGVMQITATDDPLAANLRVFAEASALPEEAEHPVEEPATVTDNEVLSGDAAAETTIVHVTADAMGIIVVLRPASVWALAPPT